ncbi:MAG: PEP-CTERM sorting domain-containing protein [Planctomycetes bacterium]|nr:PEP-CTERM sorting domain-containing protein [Planctomycetota bacterium]
MGVLPQYDYANSGNDRESDAGALQRAIWFLEQEVDTLNSAKATFFYNFAQAGAGQGLGNVVVLNVYSIDNDGDRVERQSQIAMIPTPGSLALAGLGTLAAFRRRR